MSEDLIQRVTNYNILKAFKIEVNEMKREPDFSLETEYPFSPFKGITNQSFDKP